MATNLPPSSGPYKIPSKGTRQHSRRRRQQESYQSEPKRIYASPRISQEDAELFPQIEALQNSAQRWNYISEQAGQHRQDGSVLTLGRSSTPPSLKAGITSQVALRVKHLNLWLDPNQDLLPEWLDVVAGLFINIEHLTLVDELLFEDEEVVPTVSARMRRLYVLYRLPDLKSIDDMAITRVERKMARPKTPEGEKVERHDWVSTSDSLLDSDKDGIGCVVATKEDIATQDTDTDDDSTTSSSSEFISESQMLPPCTPRDVGVEISRSLLDCMSNDVMALDNYALSDIVGEQREDSSSDIATNDNRDSSEKEPQDRIRETSLADALEVDLDGAVRSGDEEDETPIMRLRRVASHCSATSEEEKPGGLSLAPKPRGLTSMDTLEIISVASSHHEFTLACGALSFGSRSCNPGRMICGAGASSPKSKEDQRNETKRTLRLNREKLMSKVPTPSRQPPQASPHFATEVVRDGSFGAVKFFPSEGESEPHHVPCGLSPRNENITDSPKNRLPPSKSLTSPFPMQFRERPKPSFLHVATERFDEENHPTPEGPKGGMGTIMSPIPLSRINSSPSRLSSPTKAASRGELPPPCPGGRRRLVVTTAMTPLRSRKAKRILKKIKQSKHNARSTSVMDMEDDDESDEDELEEEEENIFDFDETKVTQPV